MAKRRPILGKLPNLFIVILFLFNTGFLFMLCAILILLGPMGAPFALSQSFIAHYEDLLVLTLSPISIILSLAVTYALGRIYTSLEAIE